MIDLKALSSDFQTLSNKLQTKGVDAPLLERLKEKNDALKEAKSAFEMLQSEQNNLSKLFGTYKKEGKDTTDLKATVDANKIELATLLEKQRECEEALTELALSVPNIPDDDVPVGTDETQNIVFKTVLEKPIFTFATKEHWELAQTSGWIDFERGVKLAKSRFSVLNTQAAKLERALINYMLDFNTQRGFHEMSLPFLVNAQALTGTGQLPKFADDLYKIDEEDLYLIPTAEVPLTNLFADEILSASELPLMLTAHTPCFRKEAGSAGRDTRGIIRQHQFHKVELVAITTPQQSDAMLETMIACASDLLTSLGLHHRLVHLCTGDLGFGAAKTVDIEVWLPGQNAYREISSLSNTRAFQARRAKIRYKEDNKNNFVHTLNGSSMAVGRTIVAIMENYQNEDGTITIPAVLQSYL